MGEIGFTGDMFEEAGIEAIMSSLFLITHNGEEGLQIGEFLQISEEFQEEKADGIIGMSSYRRIGRSGDGSDEGEIDQRGDEAGESAGNLPGGFDLDPPGDEGVRGEKSVY